MKRFRSLIIVLVFISGCLTTEYASHRRVNPAGHFSSLNEYLTWRPSAERFARVEVNGKQHTIAYGAMSSWILMSSGPSAYIFDDTGKLIDWSADIGDDPQFNQKWNAQGTLSAGQSLSRNEVQISAATQSSKK